MDIAYIYDIPIEEIVSVVGSALGIAREELYSLRRGRQGAWGRSLVAFLGKKLGGYPFKRFADHFKRDPVVISKGVMGIEKRLVKDGFFARSLGIMEKTLAGNRRSKIVN